MTVIHSRDDWDEGASGRVAVTAENMEVIFEEKRQAVEETKALHGILQAETLGVTEEFAEDMTNTIDGMILFAEFCDITTRSMYLTRYAEITGEDNDIAAGENVLDELEQMAVKIETWEEGTSFPYYLYSRLHPQRIRRYAKDVEHRLTKLKG